MFRRFLEEIGRFYATAGSKNDDKGEIKPWRGWPGWLRERNATRGRRVSLIFNSANEKNIFFNIFYATK